MKFWRLSSELKGYCSLLSFVDEYSGFKQGDRPLAEDLIGAEEMLQKKSYKVKRIKWHPQCDIVDTGWPSLYILSPKVLNLLEENNVSGWRPFEIELNKPDPNYDGYRGLSVIGRCGPVDYTQLYPVKTTFTPGKETLGFFYSGFEVDESSWGGKDIFLVEGTFIILVTDKLKKLITNAGISNIKFTPAKEIRFYWKDVEKHLKK